MSSIVLSFVGQQDPVSGNTDTEGSIVTLIRHLLDQQHSIQAILLLYTEGTAQEAKDTRDWLETEPSIPAAQVELIAVDETLSNDPIDLLAAVAAVKDLLLRAKSMQQDDDSLEMNASSGTPAMKSVWGIMQAAGYVSKGRVWQVRNPEKVKPGQDQVFPADMGVLRQEFDRKVIEKQLASYNYNGASVTVESSNLDMTLKNYLLQLLSYGHSRSSFDFKRAKASIEEAQKSLERFKVPEELIKDIERLHEDDKTLLKRDEKRDRRKALLCDVYWGAEIHERNKSYCNFITSVAQFQENSLRLLLDILGIKDHSPNQPNYRLDIREMIDTLECLNNVEIPLQDFKDLGEICKKRNMYIHKLAGVTEISEANDALGNMHAILGELTTLPSTNPFDRLNQAVLDLL
jgi:hypothetical protein